VQISLLDLPDVRHHRGAPAPAPHHRGQVIELITAAEARGQARLVEMNQQVLGNLDRIIDTTNPTCAPRSNGCETASALPRAGPSRTGNDLPIPP
jgi:hypothetical protein